MYTEAQFTLVTVLFTILVFGPGIAALIDRFWIHPDPK